MADETQIKVIEGLINLAVSLIKEVAQSQRDESSDSEDEYFEPEIAHIARSYCADILEAAEADGLNGCELCQS